MLISSSVFLATGALWEYAVFASYIILALYDYFCSVMNAITWFSLANM